MFHYFSWQGQQPKTRSTKQAAKKEETSFTEHKQHDQTEGTSLIYLDILLGSVYFRCVSEFSIPVVDYYKQCKLPVLVKLFTPLAVVVHVVADHKVPQLSVIRSTFWRSNNQRDKSPSSSRLYETATLPVMRARWGDVESTAIVWITNVKASWLCFPKPQLCAIMCYCVQSRGCESQWAPAVI